MYQGVDLHVHTTMSDGTLSPREVVLKAIENNCRYLSICDHDCLDAYDEELFALAKGKLELIVGVEISSIGYHILGYGLDYKNKELKESLSKLKNSRINYLNDVSLLFLKDGYRLDLETLKSINMVTKAHIARNIISLNEERLINLYGHLPSMGEFIETMMNKGCPYYVKKVKMTPLEAATLIRQYGGKVFLAHPVSYYYENKTTLKEIEDLVLQIQADGIEAYYLYVDQNNQIIDEMDQWEKFAYDHHLCISQGSDYHLSDGFHLEIGFLKASNK